MQSIKVKAGQSLFDIAVQVTGNVSTVFDIAVLNGIGVTDELTAGAELIYDDATSNSVLSYYSKRLIYPATGGTLEIEGLEPDDDFGGIGWMIIEDTFIVS